MDLKAECQPILKKTSADNIVPQIAQVVAQCHQQETESDSIGIPQDVTELNLGIHDLYEMATHTYSINLQLYNKHRPMRGDRYLKEPGPHPTTSIGSFSSCPCSLRWWGWQ